MSKYDDFDSDQLEELFSNFMIDSWSYSKVSSFARNEKAFEMNYIYGIKGKRSASTVAGEAYHQALQIYFQELKTGNVLDLPELELVVFDYIDNFRTYKWKLQKTTPTVEDCKQKSIKTVNQLLKNFLSEISIYLEDMGQIIESEIRCDGFLTINGVEIPLPCHSIIDLVFISKSGKTIVVDHKSKAAFTPDEELQFTAGRQAITYVNSYEKKTGFKIDEVWFVENKYSQNRDKSSQLNCFKIIIDEDSRKLYEALLYEPLKRMIAAVGDVDYVYMINDSDSFTDKAEIYNFWAQTMIAEVEDFNVAENKKELVAKRLKKIRDASTASINPRVIKNFRAHASEFIQYDLTNTNMTQSEKIEHTLRGFGVFVKVAHEFNGYSSDTYLLEVNAGVKVGNVFKHRLDLANILNVPSVRIQKDLVMYDGKSYISIDFSKKRERSVIFEPKKLEGMKIPIGLDNFDNTIYWDLENNSTPHMLICGATGSGKSVSIYSTIEFSKIAGIKRIIVLDPKFEFNHIKGVECYNEIEDIEKVMKDLIEEMNGRVKAGTKEMTLVVFDEFADAVSASRKGKELDVYENQVVGHYKLSKQALLDRLQPQEIVKRVCVGTDKSLEENLRVLLQKGRSCGFRIIAATQRASVKVITGDAKVNFPIQVCFRVPKEVDSKVVLDEGGAELLSGSGDGLMKSPEYGNIVRFQAFYKSK